ncbi:triphosphoribosyl-dephospho-CoA synthase, partial [Salmonella enterica]|uniref:triphosphoribosyl-dephospho-CoA synthase n=1 Tax=Salmonella enterica TaxID=28901 RepID=UPI0032B4AA71
FGIKTAEAVQDEAHELRASFIPAVDDEGFARLLAFDGSLKERGINPGTTADVVVATLFAEALLKPAPRRKRPAKSANPAQ